MKLSVSEILAILPILLKIIPGFKDFLSALTSDTECALRPKVDEILAKSSLDLLDADVSRLSKGL